MLLSYDNGRFDAAATSTLEWMMAGPDADFTKSALTNPSGNAPGPFAVGV